jgi:1-acyl-sn-glycerol-3-phosphate acyltransferase
MPDSDATDFDAGATVELAIPDGRGRLPVEPESLRDQLPGLEPERRIDDWGRSERVENFVDRTLYEFLYRHWHRVEVEGIENVPAKGAALLIANRSGLLPADAAMILKAVREEHPRPRAVHIATEQRSSRLPGLGLLLTKLGGVPDHPANVHRLLYDEQQLVLMFPEGARAATKLPTQRYRLRRFHSAKFVQHAAQAGAPIVPIAVIGAEEASPLVPALPLPAKFRIRFLEPVAADRLGAEERWRDGSRAADLAEDIRALLQENLLEMVAQRRSVWLG